MSIQIDLIKELSNLIETNLVVEVRTDECIRIIKQNFKENVEAGAPIEIMNSYYDELEELRKFFERTEAIQKERMKRRR